MKYILLFINFSVLTVFSQSSIDDLTGKEKAFLYHQTRKVSVLKQELFHLFEFTDSIPYITDTLPDYSYIEKEIVKNPDLLKIHQSQMERKADGLVYDLATRFALWELDQVLHYRNSTAKEDAHLKEDLKVFEAFVREEAPQSVIRMLTNGEYTLAKTVQGYYTPSLTVADKLASILNAGYSQLDQMLIINAIMYAQEKYVSERAQEVYKLLTNQEFSSSVLLSGVGDGGNWAEITGGFSTPYSVGLPDEIGLFRFEVDKVFNEERELDELKVKVVKSYSFTKDPIKETVVHIYVMGYHPERQTTIAIQSGSKSYVLYGKNDHRRVSPDSTYGEGTTYWRLMNRLEHFYIANLKEDLYGKRGYEYQIDLFEKKIESTKLKIKKTEYRLDELRHTPEGKPKIKKKKMKKKDLGRSDQDGGGHPTSKLSKLDKKKNIEQNRLVQLNSQLEAQKSILRQLIEDMEKAYETLVKYETKLDYMKKTMGYEIMAFEQEGSIYLFEDGAYFDYRTQDFVFPPDQSNSNFLINHISFGKELFTDQIDENFTHLSISKRNTDAVYVLEKTIESSSDRKLSVSDSIQIMEFFDDLLIKKNIINFNVIAGGIGAKGDNGYERDIDPAYASSDENAHPIYVYRIERHVDLDVSLSVYTGNKIPAAFSAYQSDFMKMKQKYPELKEMDFYSAILAKAEVEKWLQVLEECANTWIKSAADRKIILKKLKKLKAKSIQIETVGESIKI